MKLLSLNAKFKFIFFISLGLSTTYCTPKNGPDDTIYGILDTKIKSLDPAHAGNTISFRVVAQIYEGLYHYHYLKRPLKLEPQIAASLPEISADGLTYTIRLKKGIRFQDHDVFPNGKGREVTAQDFVYSWKRLGDPKVTSSSFWIFDERIVGYKNWRKKLENGQASYETPIEGFSTPDNHTIVIKLTQPFYTLPHLLSLPTTFVVPHEAVKSLGENFANKPVGSGPYQLKSWLRGSEIRMTQNKNYHSQLYPSEGSEEDKKMGRLIDSGKSLPLTKNIVIRLFPERQAMWLSFKNGLVDFAILSKDSFQEIFTDGKISSKLKAKGIKIHTSQRLDVVFFAFNMENPLFSKNKKLRQAMAHSFNSQIYYRRFFNSRGTLANGAIPPTLEGHEANFPNPIDFNLNKAKQLLAEAGYPNGKGLPEIKFELATPTALSRQMGEYYQQQMSQIGIKIKLIPNSWAQFDKKVKLKKADVFNMAWSADYPDGENFLQLFYSKNISPGSNMSNYSNSVFDKMYEQAIQMEPGPEKTKLYQKMSRWIVNEIPVFFFIHRTKNLPYHSWLKNYKENYSVHDFYKYLRVDEKIRSAFKKK